jgi:hypothetical protein
MGNADDESIDDEVPAWVVFIHVRESLDDGALAGESGLPQSASPIVYGAMGADNPPVLSMCPVAGGVAAAAALSSYAE